MRNRRAFHLLFEQQMRLATRFMTGLTGGLLLLYIDVDNFKWINDNLGHKEGDRALKDVSNIMRSCFRDSDIVARIGGDEFAVLLIGVSRDAGKLLVRRIKDKVKEFNEKEKRPYKLSLSVGYAFYDPFNPSTIDELIKKADEMMYMEKEIKKKSPNQ